MFEHGYALVIGVGVYAYAPQLDVPMTCADARALSAVLGDPQYCGYPAEQMTLLCNAEATRAGILQAIEQLATHATEHDTALIFYSGHGHYDEQGTYYLTSHDTRLTEQGRVVTGSAISQQELLGHLQALRAERVLLIFNACHAGAISPTLGAEESHTGHTPPDQTVAALLATGMGRVVLTACRENQYAFVGNGDLTLFTQALVDGLRGAGVHPHGSFISIFDLYLHLFTAIDEAVRQQIPTATRQRYRDKQEPELTILKGVGPFAVALYRGATPEQGFDATQPPPANPAVRQIDRETSQAALSQIQHGGINYGQGNTITIKGSRVSSDQRTINTGGGDYASGNIDKRQGAFISGNAGSGMIIGTNTGLIISAEGAHPSADSDQSLHHALNQVQQRAAAALGTGDDEQHDDLQVIALSLQAAIKAPGQSERRAEKLREARRNLEQLTPQHPELQPIAHLLDIR